jgi:hypothetical protein
MRVMKTSRKGITFAGAILVIFVVLFVGFIAYMTTPDQSTSISQKTYFDGLSFILPSGKIWHMGVPIARDGTLHVLYNSNSSVRFYLKSQARYLLDSVSQGHKEYSLQVTSSMGIVEVALANPYSDTVVVTGMTCYLT